MNDGNYFDDEPATASGGRRHYDDDDNDGYGFDDDDDFDEDFEDIAVNTNNKNQNKNIIQFDGLKTATTKAERRRKRRKYRNERTGKIAACVIVICIIIIVIGSVVTIQEAEHILYQDSLLSTSDSPTSVPTGTPPTTPVPTPAPKPPTFSVATPVPTTAAQHQHYVTEHTPTTAPTSAPTTAFMEEYKFVPSADTYLYLDGPNTKKSYGREEALWVQRGTQTVTASQKAEEFSGIPTIIGLLLFDTSPLPDRSRWSQSNEALQVTLRIQHKPKKDDDDIDYDLAVDDLLPTQLEIYRLPNMNSGYDPMVVEALTGEDFHTLPKEYTDGLHVGTYTVGPTDTSLNIDVTSGIIPTTQTNTFSSLYTDDQMIFLLKMSWEELPRQGDQFRTRESKRTPELIFTNMLAL